MKIEEVGRDRDALARSILEDLPDWFGRKDAREDFIQAAAKLPMLAAMDVDGKPVGFLSVKEHTSVAAEAYVLGVVRRRHRQGIGRALFDHAERQLATRGFRYLTVKTLAASHPDPNYAATRRFYEAIGFEPLEVFPTLWGSDNPCLLMVKVLRLA